MVSKDNLKHATLCVLTGLLVVCSYPKINLFFLMWIAFIPLIFVVRRTTNTKSSFLMGFLSGFVFNVSGLYWFIPLIQVNSGSYVQAFLAASLLWVYFALYWGLWSFGVQKYISLQKDKSSNWAIVIFGSCFWVLLEYIKAYFLTGFPWLIGYSQVDFTEIIQVAEFTGVYGVSFLVLFCNLCFYFWLEDKNKKKYLYTSLILIVLFTFFGSIRTHKFRILAEKEYNVSIVQPSIDQYKKWDEDYLNEILSNLQKQAIDVGKSKTDLVLWPEAVLPGVIPKNVVLVNFAKRLSAYTGSFNIFGTLYNENDKVFNAAIGFESKTGLTDAHRKNHRVPFGEIIPLRRFLTKVLKVFNATELLDMFTQMEDIEKGNDANVFKNGELIVGPIICSENFSPDIARRLVLNGAKVLTNHANDAWFFDTAAPYQHFIINVFRAVENRKFILVSANTGVSGIIEASGIVVARTKMSKKEILNGTFSQNDFKTFYTKFGDIFAKICIGVLIIQVFFLIYRRRTNS